VIVSRRSEALTAPGDQQGTFHLSPPADGLPMPVADGVEHRFVAVNGVRLHYASAGRGDALLLLHGWPQHWWAWRELIPALSERYRVICPDIRGFGWSEGGSDYGLEQLAADLVGLLDLLGIDRARFVGHGWGSEIGRQACLDWPGRFSHNVSIGAVAPWTGGSATPRLYLRSWHIYALGLLGIQATTRLGVPENALRTWRHEGTFTPTEAQTYLGPLRRPVSADATRRLYRHLLLHELPRYVRSNGSSPLQVPTLHVQGEQDPLAGTSPRRGNAETQFERLSGCGHFVAEERPAELLAQVREFLA
jgi:pimeloyl-ACP methyl ester carboxylesterase